MRKLYLVPIIHMSSDMGSLAPDFEETSIKVLGQKIWQKHKEIISGFWDSIEQFFRSIDVKGFKVYQDGLIADGAEGIRIIKEGITQGSKNYQIIGDLLERGAVLVKTEDFSLVKEEYDYIIKLTHSKSRKKREIVALKYNLVRNSLLKRRDEFIAKRINETLREKETGILFVGAYHDVLSKLPNDIQVCEVKEITKIRKYHETLTNIKGHGEDLLQLAEYLVSPVKE